MFSNFFPPSKVHSPPLRLLGLIPIEFTRWIGCDFAFSLLNPGRNFSPGTEESSCTPVFSYQHLNCAHSGNTVEREERREKRKTDKEGEDDSQRENRGEWSSRFSYENCCVAGVFIWKTIVSRFLENASLPDFSLSTGEEGKTSIPFLHHSFHHSFLSRFFSPRGEASLGIGRSISPGSN